MPHTPRALIQALVLLNLIGVGIGAVPAPTLMVFSGVGTPAPNTTRRATDGSSRAAVPSLPLTPHPILTDVQVRRAIAYCANRAALVGAAYPYLDATEQQALVSDSFLAQDHWLYQSPPITYTYSFSPTQGQQLLDTAGWTLAPGATYRINAVGEELTLKVTTTEAVLRQAFLTEMENQLRDNCGIRLLRFHTPASWIFGDASGLNRRDFELTDFAWLNWAEEGVFGERTLYACDQIPTPENDWEGQNFMGWCNPTASAAIVSATTALLRADRQTYYSLVQDEFAKDAVSLPLFNRPLVLATTPTLTGFAPDSTETYYTWNIYSWTVPATSTIVIGLIQEPGSLFTPVDQSFAARLAASLIYGRGHTTRGYDYQVQLYQSLPTLENGGAAATAITVVSGTTVVDVTGTVGSLLPGTQVFDASGQIITFTDVPISMTQLVVTGTFLSGLKWPDGSDLIQADLQLWDSINCDPASAGLYPFPRSERAG